MEYEIATVTREQVIIPRDGDRPRNPEYAELLAASIEVDGLTQLPYVRRLENNEEHEYEAVAGKHRLYACLYILGWPAIPCRVGTPTPEEAEAIGLAENLWRLPLTDAQRNKALVRWRELYMKRRGANPPDRKPGSRGPLGDGFANHVETVLGVGRTTAIGLAAVAKNLNAEQVDRLEAVGAKQGDFVAVAKLHVPEAIEETIAIAETQAVPVKEAVAVVRGRSSGPPRPSKPKAPEPLVKQELTDDQWLENHCGHVMAMIKTEQGLEVYKRDAILYRRAFSQGEIHGKFFRQLIADLPGNARLGPLSFAFKRAFEMAHPSSWKQCAICLGTGEAPGGDGQCEVCRGHGFRADKDLALQPRPAPDRAEGFLP